MAGMAEVVARRKATMGVQALSNAEAEGIQLHSVVDGDGNLVAFVLAAVDVDKHVCVP